MEPDLITPPDPQQPIDAEQPAPHPSPAPRRPRFWQKLLLLAMSTVVILLVLEVGLRMAGFSSADMKDTDTKTGLRVFRPNGTLPYRTACFSNTLKINSRGFHAPEYSDEKASGTRRIVIVGDSFVESVQVPVEKTFWYLLQQKMNDAAPAGVKVEIIPFGIGGNGTLANLDYLAAYGFPAHPDLVIDAFNSSDVDNDASTPDLDAQLRGIEGRLSRKEDTAKSGNALTAREYAVAVLKGIAKKSALVVTMYSKYLAWKAREDVGPESSSRPAIFEEKFYAGPTDVVTDAWDKQKRIFERMNALSTEQGTKLLVVAMAEATRFPPLREDWKKQFSHADKIVVDEPERVLGEVTKQLDIPYFSMFPAFDERAPREGSPPLSWACDAHYNETGHAWAADALFTYLTAHPELYAPHSSTP